MFFSLGQVEPYNLSPCPKPSSKTWKKESGRTSRGRRLMTGDCISLVLSTSFEGTKKGFEKWSICNVERNNVRNIDRKLSRITLKLLPKKKALPIRQTGLYYRSPARCLFFVFNNLSCVWVCVFVWMFLSYLCVCCFVCLWFVCALFLFVVLLLSWLFFAGFVNHVQHRIAGSYKTAENTYGDLI